MQAEFIREQSGKGTHIVEQPWQEPGPLRQDKHHPEEEDDVETRGEELDGEALAMMTAPDVMAFVKGRQARVGWKTRRPGVWRRGIRGAPAGRQRDWPRARGSSGAYEVGQLCKARTQGGRLQGAKARCKGKAMFQVRWDWPHLERLQEAQISFGCSDGTPP